MIIRFILNFVQIGKHANYIITMTPLANFFIDSRSSLIGWRKLWAFAQSLVIVTVVLNVVKNIGFKIDNTIYSKYIIVDKWNQRTEFKS